MIRQLSNRFKCLAFLSLFLCSKVEAQVNFKPYHVKWNSQSVNSSGSMPLGNGDLGANVWVNKEGVLNLLLSKTDTHSEIGRLLKIGKMELKLTPNLLDGPDFLQELAFEKGMLTIKGEKNGHSVVLSCWIDANAPLIHIDGKSNAPLKVEVSSNNWRKQARLLVNNERHSGYGVTFGPTPFLSEVDSTLSVKNHLAWCHENKTSIWQLTLDNQNISDFNQIGSDPLLGQCFGAIAGGRNFVSTTPEKISTAQPTTSFNLKVAVLKSKEPNVDSWKNKALAILKDSDKKPVEASRKAHTHWWEQFWNRHYLIVTSPDENEKTFEITQSYLLQRYLNACAGRGGLPIKFNGSIFTVDLNEDMGSAKKGFDADYREWGGNFWFQNTRLIYWNMLHAGDVELMKPLFNMYLKALPLARFRTKRYFNHDGAYFPETMSPWGSYLVDNYGWDRKGKTDGASDNLYIRYYWQGALELSQMMFDYFEYTGDTSYFRKEMAPFIRDIVLFYDKHYNRDAQGKLLITPSQSLETYQNGVVNPAPEIAGLTSLLPRILKNASLFPDPSISSYSRRFMSELPELPLADSNGTTILSCGTNLGKRANIENPELYAVFPYRLFGLGKPALELARNTFEKRVEKRWNGWHQDAIQAALLGYTNEVKNKLRENFTAKQNSSRFPAFWGPNYDWVPDQDHGNVNSLALQCMLLQSEADQPLLLPAWPLEWNVQFKMVVQGNKTIEGYYEKGKGVTLLQKPAGLHLKIMNDEKPNVIFILADDLGHGDLSSLNPNSIIQTPNIDQLAREGRSFTDAHTPASLCTPTRYGLLTGTYAWRSSLKKGVLKQYDPPLIDKNTYTIGQLFQQNNYQTACIGKWHLGWDWPLNNNSYFKDSLQGDKTTPADRLRIEKRVDFTKTLDNGPTTRGFHYYFGDDVPNYPPYCYFENNHTIGIPKLYKPDSMYGHPGLMMEHWKLEEVMPTLTSKAVNYIKTKAENHQPFFLYFALTSPHVPIAPNTKFKGSSKAGGYGDFVQESDWAVGEIMKAVKEAGIEENTLIVFTSDNGSPGQDGTNMSGEMNSVLKLGHEPNYPFRGMKTDLWEGGHHVPFIAKWTSKIEAGSTCNTTICLTDFISTCAELLGTPLPKNEARDSYSLVPLLFPIHSKNYSRNFTIHHSSEGLFAIRKGDWKLIMTGNSGGGLIPSKPEIIDGEPVSIQLYNLKNDPAETTNLFKQHPDIVRSLKDLLQKNQQDQR